MPYSGTGLGAGAGGGVKCVKMLSSSDTAAFFERWSKMMDDIVRWYSVLTSERSDDAFSCISLSRSVLSASASIRLIRSFSSGWRRGGRRITR